MEHFVTIVNVFSKKKIKKQKRNLLRKKKNIVWTNSHELIQ